MRASRTWLALIPAALLAAAVGHQLWARHRLLQGDVSAVDQVWFGRRAQVLAVVRGGSSPRARAAGLLMLERRAWVGWSAEDVAAVFMAAGDAAPVVRVAALDALLEAAGPLTLTAALDDVLAPALLDDAPIPREELDWFEAQGAGWASVARLFEQANPDAGFTPAIYGTYWLGVFDRPQLAFAQQVGEDQALRLELEAAAPPFAFEPGQAAAQVARAREQVAGYLALLAERGDPTPSDAAVEVRQRLAALVAGHPSLDPQRHLARLQAIQSEHEAQAQRDK